MQVDTKLNETSRPFFDQLPSTFKVYRGLSKAEKDDGRLGVSWSLDEAYAERYLYLKDVISVQYEYHNDKCYFEILTLKNEGVKYREVVIRR